MDLGDYAGQAGYCDAFGFEVHPKAGEDYARLAIAVGVKGGFPEDTAASYIDNARIASSERAQQAMEAFAAMRPTNDQAFVSRLTREVQVWTTACRKIARDPIGRLLVSDPPGSDETLVRDAADGVLWRAGLASWQTPYILAGGDMAEAVGLCSARIPPAKAEAYLADLHAADRFPPSVVSNANRYFAWLRRSGEDRAESMGLNATQCTNLLTKRDAALKATPH